MFKGYQASRVALLRKRKREKSLMKWTRRVHQHENYFIEAGQVQLRRVGRLHHCCYPQGHYTAVDQNKLRNDNRYAFVGTPSIHELPSTSDGRYRKQSVVVRLD